MSEFKEHYQKMLEEIKETVIDLKIIKNTLNNFNQDILLLEKMNDLLDKSIQIKENIIKQATEIQ